MLYNLNISEVLGRAWELTKRHWLIMIVVSIAVNLFVQLLSGLLGGSTAIMVALNQLQNGGQPDPAAIVTLVTSQMGSTILLNIVQLVLMVGVIKLYLDKAEGSEEDFTLKPWQQEPMTYVKYVVVGLVTNIICGIGYLLCILPGIFLSARLQFATLAVIKNPQIGIVEAIQYSWNITEGNTLNLILLVVSFFVMAIVGLLCCCVGVIVADVVVNFASVVAFLTLAANNNTAKPAGVYGNN